jgi:hypothetical protein
MKKIISTYSLTIALLVSFTVPHTLISSPTQPFFTQKLEQGREKVKNVAHAIYERWQNLMSNSKSGVRRRVDGVKGSLEAQVALVGFMGTMIAYVLEARAHKKLKDSNFIIKTLADEQAHDTVSLAQQTAGSIQENAQQKARQVFDQLVQKARELDRREASIVSSTQETEEAKQEVIRLMQELQTTRAEVAAQASRFKDILASMPQTPAKAGRSPRVLEALRSSPSKRASREQQEEFVRVAQDIQAQLLKLSQETPSASEEATVWSAFTGSVSRARGAMGRAFSFRGAQGEVRRPQPKIPTSETAPQPPLHSEWSDFYSGHPSSGGFND